MCINFPFCHASSAHSPLIFSTHAVDILFFYPSSTFLFSVGDGSWDSLQHSYGSPPVYCSMHISRSPSLLFRHPLLLPNPLSSPLCLAYLPPQQMEHSATCATQNSSPSHPPRPLQMCHIAGSFLTTRNITRTSGLTSYERVSFFWGRIISSSLGGVGHLLHPHPRHLLPNHNLHPP